MVVIFKSQGRSSFFWTRLMKVSKAKAAEHRAAIVKAASKLFREAGVGGVGVAEITSAASLTHGGFYRHFESKEALFREACLQAFQEATEIKKSVTTKFGFEALRRGYLADPRIDGTPECPIATLASEVSRHSADVQGAFAEGLRAFLGTAGHEVGSPEWNRETSGIATLVGALVMARAINKADKSLARAIVAAALESPDGKDQESLK